MNYLTRLRFVLALGSPRPAFRQWSSAEEVMKSLLGVSFVAALAACSSGTATAPNAGSGSNPDSGFAVSGDGRTDGGTVDHGGLDSGVPRSDGGSDAGNANYAQLVQQLGRRSLLQRCRLHEPSYDRDHHRQC